MLNTLSLYIQKPEELPVYLDSLSNARRRQEGERLGQTALLSVPESLFWQIFSILVLHDRKAYLVTLLKALCQRLEQGTVSLLNSPLAQLSKTFTDVDRQKILLHLLPLMKTPQEAQDLFSLLGLTDAGSWLPHLLNQKTILCGFMLLKSIRYHEDNRSLILRSTIFLMKRGDTVGFNLASILKTAYALDEIRGTFSLHLSPYQLSRLENSFSAFSQAVSLN